MTTHRTNSHISVGDQVYVKVGDEKGGWGIVVDVPATSPDGLYHVGLYGSSSDVRVYGRAEITRPRNQPGRTVRT